MKKHVPSTFNTVTEASDQFASYVESLSAEDFLHLQFAVQQREKRINLSPEAINTLKQTRKNIADNFSIPPEQKVKMIKAVNKKLGE